MAVKTTTLDPAVRDVLIGAGWADGVLTLPPRLDRKLYQRVDKALRALGGTWDRHKGGHVFPPGADGSAAIAAVSAAGAFVDPKANGFFPTPPALIATVMDLAKIEPGMSVLEPSAGTGALADAAAEATRDERRICVCELMPSLLVGLQAKGYRVLGADFLELSPFYRFDRVVMNPPFTGGADLAHVAHAWQMVKPGGVLVAIMAAGVRYNAQRKHVAMRELMAAHGELIQNPRDSFAAVGTKVDTVTVVLWKPVGW